MKSIEATELDFDVNTTRPKYRKIIEEFIKMDIPVGKVSFDYQMRAREGARMLRRWVKRGEKINIFQKGYDVYLVKEE